MPCKTGGRSYDAISKRASEMGVPIPELSLVHSMVVEHGGKKYVFVALWDDEVPHSREHIYKCTASALMASVHAHMRSLAMPLLGGTEGDSHIGEMERAIYRVADAFEPTGLQLPEDIVFVTF